MRAAPVSVDAESIKLDSNYLAGTIGEELVNDRDDFDHDAELLLKFHGIYQQDDRDVRRARTQPKLPLDYSCMVRASVPGGVITAEQWLALDRVAAAGRRQVAPHHPPGGAVPRGAQGRAARSGRRDQRVAR